MKALHSATDRPGPGLRGDDVTVTLALPSFVVPFAETQMQSLGQRACVGRTQSPQLRARVREVTSRAVPVRASKHCVAAVRADETVQTVRTLSHSSKGQAMFARVCRKKLVTHRIRALFRLPGD